MKEINISQEKVALVDDEDFDFLNQYKWSATKHRKTYYARGRVNGNMENMHRMIMGKKGAMSIDHKDRNGLNNQRKNLRFCTPSQSAANRASTGTSKYRGVFLLVVKNKIRGWAACIQKNWKYKRIGLYEDEKEAALAYNKAAKVLHGEFANLNKI